MPSAIRRECERGDPAIVGGTIRPDSLRALAARHGRPLGAEPVRERPAGSRKDPDHAVPDRSAGGRCQPDRNPRRDPEADHRGIAGKIAEALHTESPRPHPGDRRHQLTAPGGGTDTGNDGEGPPGPATPPRIQPNDQPILRSAGQGWLRGQSSRTNVTFRSTRNSATLPSLTITFCSFTHAPWTFFKVLAARAMPTAMASSKLFGDAAVISTTFPT